MTDKKKLWQIFGPVILAFGLIGLLFLLPFPLNHMSQQGLREASVSFSDDIIKGQGVKRAAFAKGEKFVPFFGSSELTRFDNMHPSVLAAKYHRDYQPFLMGKPGTEAMIHYMSMQEMQPALDHKKAVFIISPQWFTKDGVNAAFSTFYSPLQLTEWFLNMGKEPTATDKFMAQALLNQQPIKNNDFYARLLNEVKDGHSLSAADLSAIKFQNRILSREDELFTNYLGTNNWNKDVVKQGKKLPATYNESELDRLAVKAAQKETSNNNFQIKNSFYTQRVQPSLKRLKGAQTNFDYRQSIEYSYFQAVLQVFAKEHTDVLFIITPVNERWSNYTGLNQDMYQQSVAKMKHQLTSQGFNNIADLSKQGGDPYFMQDTIHIGWRGWLAADQAIKPFLSSPYQETHYQMNDDYLSQSWQNLDPSQQSMMSYN
ncbi:D-alanyl-lipoteichoic acid biosynthesis protein DltD [Lactobacillaceae bacterium L1_55_11]|nr:D-alanyl-lipoteichoic acid biosynthesis protein DltD [Lactobacillaceae bacterium L1_55_11]